MAAITKGRTFVSGEVVTPSKLNTLVDGATISGIVDANVLGPITGANKVANSATTAASANTPNAIVVRDASGNFSAGTADANAVSASAFTGPGTTALFVPTGSVVAFAMNAAPSGWLAANGAAVSRTTYSALWTALGTTSSPYGQGDGSTTFNLPDLQASFVRGAGTDGVATAGTFGVKQADDVKSHAHTTNSGRSFSAGNVYNVGAVGFAAAGTASSATGGTETRPRNIAMLYCIKF